MIQKTTEYKQFIFREDNRESINQPHLNRLIESIKAKNLLDMRPIIVNEKMEVLDGQHRLMAAQKLGVEIYYKIEKQLNALDIITLNVSKSWGLHDYMNFYVKNGYSEYIKLAEFTKKNNLHLRVALNITAGKKQAVSTAFRKGEYVFSSDIYSNEFDACWQTIDYIKRMNGCTNAYLNTAKFWTALIKLVKDRNFDIEKWMSNLSKMVERVTIKATTQDYMRMFMEINNWKNTHKIDLLADTE